MPDRRIRIDTSKVEVLNLLVDEPEKKIFGSYADAIAFAAALGASRQLSRKLDKPTKEPAPIRQDVFANQGYDTLINLLALHNKKDPGILSSSPESEDERINIFEEFANGGLELLKEELKGVPAPLDQLLLLMNKCREDKSKEEDEETTLENLI